MLLLLKINYTSGVKCNKMYCLRKYLSNHTFLFCGEYEDKEFTKQTPYKLTILKNKFTCIFQFPFYFHQFLYKNKTLVDKTIHTYSLLF